MVVLERRALVGLRELAGQALVPWVWARRVLVRWVRQVLVELARRARQVLVPWVWEHRVSVVLAHQALVPWVWERRVSVVLAHLELAHQALVPWVRGSLESAAARVDFPAGARPRPSR